MSAARKELISQPARTTIFWANFRKNNAIRRSEVQPDPLVFPDADPDIPAEEGEALHTRD